MKNIDLLVKELSPEYSVRTIDGERVIYHKINKFYDIEVSGLDNRKKSPNPVIYVWQLYPVEKIVETVELTDSLIHLVDTLSELRLKYAEETPPD